MTRAAAPALQWRAGPDLISHAAQPRQPRTLCGKPIVLERFAWPPQRECIACGVLAAGVIVKREGAIAG